MSIAPDRATVAREPVGNKVSLGAAPSYFCIFCPHDPLPPSRRSIQNNTYWTYQCLRGKACSITVETRSNCQWCRYQRCLAVGMKPSSFLFSESKLKFSRDKKEKNEASAVPSARVSPPPQSPGHAVAPPSELPSAMMHNITKRTDTSAEGLKDSLGFGIGESFWDPLGPLHDHSRKSSSGGSDSGTEIFML